MNVLTRVFRKLAGLFVDDGSLAIIVLGVVAAAASASLLSGLWAGGVLLVGSLWALYVNVVGMVRRTCTPDRPPSP
jgi:hypothetical protein